MYKGKYEPLLNYLLNCKKNEVTMSFNEVESILGFGLPASARNYDEWWNWTENGN